MNCIGNVFRNKWYILTEFGRLGFRSSSVLLYLLSLSEVIYFEKASESKQIKSIDILFYSFYRQKN